MSPSDNQQTEILRQIWQEMKTTREALSGHLDQLSQRLDRTREELSQRLDRTREELSEHIDAQGRRVTESEMRLATATTQLAGDVQGLSGLIREWREEHRDDRARLEKRVSRLEEHVGLTASGT